MRLRRLTAMLMAVLLTVGAIPMQPVMAAPEGADAVVTELDDAAEPISEITEEISETDEEMSEVTEESSEVTSSDEADIPESESLSDDAIPEDESVTEETVTEDLSEAEKAELVGNGTGLTLDGNGGLVRTEEYDQENYDYIYTSTYKLDNPTAYLYNYMPKREGYWFAGWYDGDDTSTANYLSQYDANDSDYCYDSYRNYLKVTPAAGSTIYAGWENPATLDFNGGTKYDSDLGESVGSMTLEERTTNLSDYRPKRDGWYFTGWYSDQSCTVKVSEDDNPDTLKKSPQGNTTIYAGWTQDTWTVTYDLGGKATYNGNLSNYMRVDTVIVKVPQGSKLTSGYVPDSDNMKYKDQHDSLKGWATTEGGDVISLMSSYAPEGDITLYAVYDNSNKVIFYHSGEGGYFKSNEYDNELQMYPKLDIKQERIQNNYVQIYTSSYYLPKNDNPAMAFVDWYTDEGLTTPVEKYANSSCTEAYTGSGSYYYIKKGTEDIHLYAMWAATNKVLTLDANGGYFNDNETFGETVTTKKIGTASGVEIDESVTNPKHEDKHKKFAGWYQGSTKKVDAGDYSTNIEATITADTTWTAKWTDSYKVVTVDAGDGYFDYYDGDKDVKKAKKATFRVVNGKMERTPNNVGIDDPHKTFDGWYIGTKKIESLYDYKFTADTTITAKYTDCYAVTVNYNGGYYEEREDNGYVHKTASYVLKVPKGKTINEAQGYIKEALYEGNAKIFGGWYLSTDTEHSNQIQYYDYVPESDIELVAFWANNYTVTFDAGDGSFGSGSKTRKYNAVENTFFKYNDKAAIPDDPDIDDDNRVFGGWLLNGNKVDRDTILNAKITDDVTYTASYVAAYSVTFDPNGGTFVSKTPNYDNTKYKIKVALSEPIRGKVPTVRSTDTDHRVLSGWYKTKNGEELSDPVDPYSDTFEGTVELYAGWVDCYKLTFHTNSGGASFANGTPTQVVRVVKGTAFRYGEDYGSNKDKKDVIFESPDVVTNDGYYVLPGWYSSEDLTGDKYVFSSNNHYKQSANGTRTYYDNMYGFIPTSDMDFYARIVTDTVTVKFNINDSNARFNGDEWQRKQGYSSGKPYPSVLDEECKVWTVIVPKGIEFGEIGEPTSFEYETRKGKDYRWAYNKSTCKDSERVASDFIVNSNMTVYCKWTPYGSGGGGGNGKSSEITFHAGEGYFENYSNDKTRKTEKNSYTYGNTDWQNCPTPLIDDDTRAFKGWYYDAELTRPYPAEYQMVRYSWGSYYYELCYPAKVDDLYAAYGDAYTVVFDANGGYFDEDYDRTKDPGQDMRETTTLRTKTYPGQSIMISDYTKRVRRDGDKIFDGWYTDKTYSDGSKVTVYAFDNQSEHFRPTGECTLYAKWVDYEKPESITASVNGGQSVTLDIGESKDLNTVVTPSLTGTNVHWFVDWYSIGRNNTNSEHPVKLNIDGKVTGRAEGEAEVYAVVNGVRSNELTINVTNEVVSSTIEVTDKDGNPFTGTAELFTGEGFIIKGIITPAETADDLAAGVRWESSDSSVVRVTPSGDGRDANVIAGESEGTATITATLGKKAATVTVHVTNPVRFSVKELIMTAKAGAAKTLSATILASAYAYPEDIEIKAYDAETEEESDLISISRGAAEGSDSKKTEVITITPTATGLAIDGSRIIKIVAKVSVNGKDYTDSCLLTLNEQQKAGEISASIATGSHVAKGTRVLLNSGTPDTEIFYTLGEDKHPDFNADGTPKDGTILYANAIIISSDTIIHAVAVRSSRKNSSEIELKYYVDEWRDAEAYKEYFDNKLGDVPEGFWFALGDKVYTTAGPTEFSTNYTGSKITFNDKLHVFAGTKELVENRDYTLSYANNTAAAGPDAGKKAPTVTVKGKGNYAKTAKLTFTISKANMSYVDITSEMIVTVNAATKLNTVKPVLTYNGKKLAAGKDYTLVYYKDSVSEANVISDADIKSFKTEADKTYFVQFKAKEVNFTGTKFESVKVESCGAEKVQVSKLKFGNTSGKALKIPYYSAASDADKAVYYDGYGKIILEKVFGPDAPLACVYVKDVKTPLVYNTDYTVTEMTGDDLRSAGKHSVIIEGKEGTAYIGRKTVTFEITGAALNKVKVAGLKTTGEYKDAPLGIEDLFNSADKTIVAQNNSVTDPSEKWNGVTLYTTTSVKEGKKTVTRYNALTEGTDYRVEFFNSGKVGKYTLTFVGINGYSGQIKKNVTIKAYNLNDAKKGADSKISVSLDSPNDVIYSKAGAKPSVTVAYDGRKLIEGEDYTVSYKNNAKVVINYNDLKTTARPTVVIKGKGNYTGSNVTAYFNIKRADVEDTVIPFANDVAFNNKGKAGYFLVKPKLMDNGKEVKAGKNQDIDPIKAYDYSYYYAEDTILNDGVTEKNAGERLSASDDIPTGTMIEVRVKVAIITNNNKIRTKESNYAVNTADETTELSTCYRLVGTGKDISKAAAKLKSGVKFSYNYGNEIIPIKSDDIDVTLKGVGSIPTEGYEIISVSNNRFLGTATVTIRGKGEYGGTKTFTFKIGARAFS